MRIPFRALAGAALVAVVCGIVLWRVQQGGPAGRAQAFLDACRRNDTSAIRAALTARARSNVSVHPNEESPPKDMKPADWRIGRTTITGDTASVAITMKDDSGTEAPGHLKLRREDGEWRVYAMAVEVPPAGRELVLDFEHPESIAGEALALGLRTAAHALTNALPKIGEELGRGLRQLGDGLSRGLTIR